uniref:Uncharacterized protein n=1 Tax=Romanomermis culicivorax TaxID=13658 RepID=A0A915JQQ6_ROMCU
MQAICYGLILILYAQGSEQFSAERLGLLGTIQGLMGADRRRDTRGRRRRRHAAFFLVGYRGPIAAAGRMRTRRTSPLTLIANGTLRRRRTGSHIGGG